MKLTIVGTGYVGLVTGACMAEMGHKVMCLDIDPKKIAQLSRGEIPIFEPGLKEIIKRNLASGRLSFTSDLEKGIQSGQVCFITVNTPSLENGGCDLSAVEKVADTIGSSMSRDLLVVTKSTVPIGTTHHVLSLINEKLSIRNVPYLCSVVSNPEFLKEGSAVHDCLKPDRVIIGCDSLEVAGIMQEIYAPFMLSRDRLIVMDVRSAEMTKYASNAMLATRISFMNELAGLCEKTGASIREVRKGMGADIRIGYQFLYAGAGFGGSCFPKDLRALRAQAANVDHPTPILDAVTSINEKQKRLIGEKIIRYYSEEGSSNLEGKTIALLGLAFKPDTDDMREAPSLVLISQLIHSGASLRLYDPVSMKNAKKHIPHLPQITWCENEYEAASQADAVALMTEWKQFRLIDFEQLKSVMRGRAFFDGRNQYSPTEMENRGFDYICIGLAPKSHKFRHSEKP